MFILPLNKDNDFEHKPYVVIGLILINGIVLVITNYVLNPSDVFKDFGFVPSFHHFPTLFSSMFLHAGFWHFFGNSWFLWMFGPRVEDAFGKALFVAAYLLCGLGGSALHYLLNSQSSVPCVGASGAISGIAGAYFILYPRSRFDLVIYFLRIEVKTIQTFTRGAVGAWIAEQTLLGLITKALPISSTAFWAHIGGFLVGLLLAWWIRSGPLNTDVEVTPDQEDESVTQLKIGAHAGKH